MTVPIDRLIDMERFPLFDTESEGYHVMIGGITNALELGGCAVLRDFIKPEFRTIIARQFEGVSDLAYDRIEQVNVYNTDIDIDYPAGHPAGIIMKRGNAFVAQDLIPENAIISHLYSDRKFKEFIAHCFGLRQLFELDDPYAGLCLNVLRPGAEHPWHFDTNEFTVSMLTQEASSGGIFEYCPNIRTASSENFDGVLGIINGNDVAQVKRLALRLGDLQLFKGRYGLHRVSEVGAGVERHSAIFAYSELPGVIGSVERTRQLFGRVAPEHELAAACKFKTDRLMD